MAESSADYCNVPCRAVLIFHFSFALHAGYFGLDFGFAFLPRTFVRHAGLGHEKRAGHEMSAR
jgi:hypothetical protein